MRIDDRRIAFESERPNRTFDETGYETPKLEDLMTPAWYRVCLAIVVLERIATTEAREVLKELSRGHPDIKPTREAKAALERLKAKK